MWLVLCFPDDAAAHWAACGLMRRGMMPLVAVSPDAIVCSRDLVHEIDSTGDPRTTFTLPDGRAIDSASVRGALNRVTALPLAHLAGAAIDDRRYAEHELYAVVLSVLHGLGDRMINPPTAQGLAGRLRPAVEWLWLATRAGFRTADSCDSDGDGLRISDVPGGMLTRAIVLDDRIYGAAVPSHIGVSAIALAGLAETRLLGVDVIESPRGHWWFGAASTAPDLRIGGEPLLEALAVALDGPRGCI